MKMNRNREAGDSPFKISLVWSMAQLAEVRRSKLAIGNWSETFVPTKNRGFGWPIKREK